MSLRRLHATLTDLGPDGSRTGVAGSGGVPFRRDLKGFNDPSPRESQCPTCAMAAWGLRYKQEPGHGRGQTSGSDTKLQKEPAARAGGDVATVAPVSWRGVVQQ